MYKFLHIRHVVCHTLSNRNKLVAHFLSKLTFEIQIWKRIEAIRLHRRSLERVTILRLRNRYVQRGHYEKLKARLSGELCRITRDDPSGQELSQEVSSIGRPPPSYTTLR